MCVLLLAVTAAGSDGCTAGAETPFRDCGAVDTGAITAAGEITFPALELIDTMEPGALCVVGTSAATVATLLTGLNLDITFGENEVGEASDSLEDKDGSDGECTLVFPEGFATTAVSRGSEDDTGADFFALTEGGGTDVGVLTLAAGTEAVLGGEGTVATACTGTAGAGSFFGSARVEVGVSSSLAAWPLKLASASIT